MNTNLHNNSIVYNKLVRLSRGVKILLCVKDILEFPCLKGCRVLAGQKGLENQVRCVDIVEVPDADRWVTPGTFLITTAYAYREDPSKLKQLIHIQAEGGASGIGIKLGRFIQELPPDILETADREKFPVVFLPPGLAYVPVIREVMSRILERENMLRGPLSKQDILAYMIGGNISKEENFVMLHQLHLIPSDPYCFMLFDPSEGKGIKDNLIWDIVGRTQAERKEFLMVQIEKEIGIVFILRDKSNFSRIKEAARQEIQSASPAKSGSCYISISGLHVLSEGIKTAYEESCSVLSIYKKVMDSEAAAFLDFDDISFLSFLYTHPDREGLTQMSRSILKPVLDYDIDNRSDLLETLQVFLFMDCNQKRTAETLHLHRNSLRYRLNQIEKILGTDFCHGLKLHKLSFALITRTLLEEAKTHP